MDRVKEWLGLIMGGRLIVEGRDRTYAKAPLWLALLCALASLRLAAVTALLAVAFGMRARIVKA